jgi:hypothetical protein
MHDVALERMERVSVRKFGGRAGGFLKGLIFIFIFIPPPPLLLEEEEVLRCCCWTWRGSMAFRIVSYCIERGRADDNEKRRVCFSDAS